MNCFLSFSCLLTSAVFFFSSSLSIRSNSLIKLQKTTIHIQNLKTWSCSSLLDAKDLKLFSQVRNCSHKSLASTEHKHIPLALPHFASEIFQLLGLPVGVLDLVHLLEPISAANSITRNKTIYQNEPTNKEVTVK